MRVSQLRLAVQLAQEGCQLTEAAQRTGLSVGQLMALERRDNVRFKRRRYEREHPSYPHAAEVVRTLLAQLQQVTQRA